jgi:predicted SAM-dependent methyltransferase
MKLNTCPDQFILNSQFTSLDDLYAAYGGKNFKIDLGCGFVKPQGFIGLDNRSGERSQIANEDNAPDILLDLNRMPLPFPDNSCIEVRASHFIEHSDVMHIIDECYRVLRPGGVFLFVVPYANSAEGMYPGHNIFFTEKWFYKNLTFQKKFKIQKEAYFPSEDYQALPWFVRKLLPFSFARKFLFNACWQMMLSCISKK